MKVAVSFLSSPKTREETIKLIEQSDADYIHIDMMDGEFVENTNCLVPEIKELFKETTKPLDLHMMVCSPNKYIKDIAKIKNLGYVTIHYESHRRPIDVINQMKHANLKIGIAINPDTKVSHIVPLLHLVDQVLVMSVVPGKGGQKFMESILYKIESLKDIREENNFHYIISVDGGINEETAKLVKDAGVDMLVSGSYITYSNDYNEAINNLR